MDAVVYNIKELRLDVLDNPWVEAVYSSDFLSFGEIPFEYDSLDIDNELVFQNIIERVNSWLETASEPDENVSWAVLSPEVPYRKVLAILGYHIDQGPDYVMDEKTRLHAVLAARAYFSLLSIPGFKVYEIYHSQLLANSLGCLGFIQRVCELYTQQKTRGVRIPNIVEQVNALVKQLQMFMADVIFVVPQLQLKHNDMNFRDILDKLLDVTSGGYVNKMDIDKIELTKLSLDIYVVIENLLNDKNKVPIPEAVKIMFKCLHAKFVAACLDTKFSDYNVQASYVTYCGLLLSVYGKTGLNNFVVLLEHLSYSLDGMDRAEIRLNRVKMVTGLMSLLPKSVHDKFLAWIITLSKSAKCTHRLIAVDIFDHLLFPETRKNMKSPYYFVRGASGFSVETAVAVLNGVPIKEAKKLGLRNKAALANGQEKPQPTDSDAQNVTSEQDMDVDVSDEELRGVLQQRSIPLPIGQILHALYQRVQDASGAVRMRSIGALGKCFDNTGDVMKGALEDLNGEVSRLKLLASRCLCDERATVRRSGVTYMHRLLETQEAAPNEVDLEIMVRMCRDACVSVRTVAITALGSMVVKSPSLAVMRAFLQGPLLQLSDPENKVQDLVKSLVQSTLVERIQKYSVGHEDPIPWMLLGGVVTLNMRQHLQKICVQLAKTTTCINVRLVDCLSTHLGQLGVARDLQALLLLASVAREVDYCNPSFALDYYYELVDPKQNETRDPRLMTMALELLTVWSRFLRDEQRARLRDSLARNVASDFDDGCRVNYVLLAAHLDMSDLNWATELMQLAERAALRGGAGEELARAADLSLVAPLPPSQDLLHLFRDAMKAMATSEGDLTEKRAGMVVAAAGRLCVRSRVAAEQLARPAAALLHAPHAPLGARVNALLMLSDVCTRYTNIVEPLMNEVCACLDVTAPTVLRRSAVRAVSRLLLSGFLRLRTPLYFKYCGLLADEDHCVREPAEYYVTSILKPDTIFKHFVECVRYFNSEASEHLSFDSRQLIYDVMLQRLSLVQRLNTQVCLARELLQRAASRADDGEPLDAAARHQLLDAITVLCGPRMRLPKKPSQANDELRDMDDLEERITKNIVSSRMKHTVATVMVPAVLRLHARLRAGGGQLVTYLVRLATDLLEDYRQEIEDLIEADEELVEQIQQFRDTIGLEPAKGNARNLVTTSAPPEPDTPRSSRRRPSAHTPDVRKKRMLDM